MGQQGRELLSVREELYGGLHGGGSLWAGHAKLWGVGQQAKEDRLGTKQPVLGCFPSSSSSFVLPPPSFFSQPSFSSLLPLPPLSPPCSYSSLPPPCSLFFTPPSYSSSFLLPPLNCFMIIVELSGNQPKTQTWTWKPPSSSFSASNLSLGVEMEVGWKLGQILFCMKQHLCQGGQKLNATPRKSNVKNESGQADFGSELAVSCTTCVTFGKLSVFTNFTP